MPRGRTLAGAVLMAVLLAGGADRRTFQRDIESSLSPSRLARVHAPGRAGTDVLALPQRSRASIPGTVAWAFQGRKWKGWRWSKCPLPRVQPHAPQSTSLPGYTTVSIAPERQQLIGVRTGEVVRDKLQMSIRAVGIIEPDQRRLAHPD